MRQRHDRSIMKDVIGSFAALAALPVSAAILDEAGTIIATNDAWNAFGRRNGLHLPRSGIGTNYLDFCRSDDVASSRFAEDLQNLLAGRLDLLTHVYPCHSPREQRWFCLIALPLSLKRPAGVGLLHVNVTDLLPLPIRRGPMPGRTDQAARSDLTRDLDTVGSAVERSVSDALVAQLQTMLGHGSARHVTSTHPDAARASATRLSKRQMQVLRLLGEGKSNKEIAKALLCSPNTVKVHVSAILRQLELKSRTQAALLASQIGTDGPPGLNHRASIRPQGRDVPAQRTSGTRLICQHRHPR